MFSFHSPQNQNPTLRVTRRTCSQATSGVGRVVRCPGALGWKGLGLWNPAHALLVRKCTAAAFLRKGFLGCSM